jgi:RimJ/RimL family protein N-acetyltransferase
MLVQVGRDEKLARITATILADNHEMQHVAKKADFAVHAEPGTHEYTAEIAL